MGAGWETSLQRIVMTALYTTLAAFVVYFVVSWAADIADELITPINRAVSAVEKPPVAPTSILPLHLSR